MSARLSLGKLGPKEALQLSKSIDQVLPIVDLEVKNVYVNRLKEDIQNCHEISGLIKKTLTEDPPSIVSKGNVIDHGIKRRIR